MILFYLSFNLLHPPLYSFLISPLSSSLLYPHLSSNILSPLFPSLSYLPIFSSPLRPLASSQRQYFLTCSHLDRPFSTILLSSQRSSCFLSLCVQPLVGNPALDIPNGLHCMAFCRGCCVILLVWNIL